MAMGCHYHKMNNGKIGCAPVRSGAQPKLASHRVKCFLFAEKWRSTNFVQIGALLLVLGICATCIVNPIETVWFPKCLFKQLTGFDCPGCGTARAIHATAHGDFSAALHYNPILVVVIPFLVAITVKPNWARKRCVASIAFSVLIGWMILRNTLSFGCRYL